MANHDKWLELTIIEKIELIGKVVHLIQNNTSTFKMMQSIIKVEIMLGTFNDIKINDNGLHDNSRD